MRLLERETELAALEEAMTRAAAGRGRVVLLSGEAGIGKTSVVRELVRRAGPGARTLMGACDDLVTPRTLGPFHDLPLPDGSPLRRALAGGDRDDVLAAVLDELGGPRPTVLVIEDAHWADEATRDVVAFLARRVAALPALLIVTYRDGLPLGHPIRATLGAMTGPHVLRLALRPLSLAGLAALADGSGVSAEELHGLTRGNPFLAVEALAAPAGTVPHTVRDIVAARLAELAPATRWVVTLLAAAPSGIEVPLPAALERSDASPAAIAEAERAGLAEVVAGRARFRHELLRRAVESVCTASEMIEAHSRLLEVARAGGDPARILHHAVGAGDVDTIVGHAPGVARAAAALGYHRDAAAALEQAIRHRHALPVAARAALHLQYAFELYLSNEHVAATAEAREAVTLLEGLGDTVALAKALTLLAHVSCWAAEPEAAADAARRAIDLLSGSPPRSALVMAHGNLAFVQAMQGDFPAARSAAAAGLDIAARSGLRRAGIYAAILLGAVRFLEGDAEGEETLLRALAEARETEAHEYVPMICTWLCMGLLRNGRPAEIEPWVEYGVSWSEEHQIAVGMSTLRMLGYEAAIRRGRWREAEAGLAEIVADPHATGWGQSVACTLLGRLRARRGARDALALLERGWRMAVRSGEVERLARAGAAWYEWAWLHRDERARQLAEEALEPTVRSGNPWLLGELLAWRAFLAGSPAGAEPGGPVAEPWESGLRGRWEHAARAWEEMGWPFERARELAASGRPEALLEALAICHRLDATATAARLSEMLRAQGVRRVPRGPARRTRANLAGLTARQMEVAEMLAAGHTNAEIAARLVISTRTVEHHVAAVLDKLGAASRRDVAALLADAATSEG